jgi:hypothetical protein
MFYISLLQLLKGKPLTYKVPPLPPIIINNGNSSYFIDLINDIYKKHNLNNSNFLLNGKDIKYKPKKPITKLRPMYLP